jgi:hypothetical protein
MKPTKFVHGLSLGILLGLAAGAVSAQSAPPSSASDPLAAAAKRAQDSKKDASKTARVWDNDNIPKAGHEISVVGSTDAAADGTNPAVIADANAVATPDAAAGGANPAAPTSGPAPNQAELDAKIQAQIAGAKENIASMKTDLDLMQRTLVLDSQMYYSKPDYSSDRGGARKLTDEQAKIADKQQAIDEAEKKLAELETLLKASPSQNVPAVNND